MSSKESRGYSKDSFDLPKNDALELIESINPIDRTNGYRALKKHYNDATDEVQFFVDKLLNELMLYPRIEIQQLLSLGTKNTIDVLLKNIHLTKKEKPNIPSKKKSYPLSRNLTSRIIGCMDYRVFPYLIKKIGQLNDEDLTEVLEGIGHMIFYNELLDTKENFFIFQDLLNKNLNNGFLTVNLITLLSAFKQKECLEYVKEIEPKIKDIRMIAELKRTKLLLEQ